MASSGPVDPRWPKLLSLTAHEFRTPMTVVAGYIRMLLKERAGPLAEQQRRLLEEAEKSCGRLSALLAEVSDLAGLESGSVTFTHATVDVADVLREAIAALPPMPDRDVRVELERSGEPGCLNGDAARLRTGLAAVLVALRRELVTTDLLVIRASLRINGARRTSWIAIGDPMRVSALENAEPQSLTEFDEWRGGCGLSLAIARRIINAHDGAIWSPVDAPRAGAVIELPNVGTRPPRVPASG